MITALTIKLRQQQMLPGAWYIRTGSVVQRGREEVEEPSVHVLLLPL